MTDTATTTATTTTDSTTEMLADRYIAIWNETAAATRRELIAKTWAEDGHYLDPLLAGDGRDGIDAMTAGFQSAYPGHTFRRVGAIDQHHDRIRFGWELVTPDGQTFVIGTDYGEITPDGLLRSITGFFEQP